MKPTPVDTRTGLLDAAERLVLAQGLSATSVEAIAREAGVTKGAFFHHFASKAALGLALVERYAERDWQVLDTTMERAERLDRDPLQQLLLFVGLIEEGFRPAGEGVPGCLFASYVYEAQLLDEHTHQVIRDAVEAWRDALGAKLRQAAALHPPRARLDVDAVADMLTVIVEGAFVVSRSMTDPALVVDQLRQYRAYLELLFGVAAPGE
jgi:TetR/AcrR family transcriptional repressor of nem operon